MVPAVNGNEYDIRIKTQKTEKELTLPLSTDALKLCGDRGSGRIFQGLSRSAIDHPLKHWLHRAGIKKKVTFHSARHTFATTITLSQGVAIETISKLLGHRNIRTTQIYATITHSQLDGEMERLSKRINSLYRNLIPSDAPETGTKLI